MNNRWLYCGLLLCMLSPARIGLPSVASEEDDVGQEPAREALVLVIGAAGEGEYRNEFSQWAEHWKTLARHQGWALTVIDEQLQQSPEPKVQLQTAVVDQASSCERLWIVLLGHGTFANNVAKFNLAGPDVSAQEMKQWLRDVTTPLVIINCSSASAPFLTELAGKDRIVLTSTRSGSELNYSRFGKFLSSAITDAAADIDHDQEVSLLEAFLAASAQTERFFREDARLATEHALLDDNGDRVGTSGDFYRGVQPVKEAAEGRTVDGVTASRIILYSSPDAPVFPPELAARRAAIELELDALRQRKPQLSSDDYFTRLETLLLELARVYDEVEALAVPDAE